MLPSREKRRLLVGSVLIVFIINDCFAGHHHGKDDDDDDDDDPQCYPGRNCRPGCYCSASYCRPYFPPHNQYLKRYACTGYNYPKWKIWKKGSKHDGGNSTVMVVIAHHHENSDAPGATNLSTLLKNNNFTTHDQYELPIPLGHTSTQEVPLSVIRLSPFNNSDNHGTNDTDVELYPSTPTSTPNSLRRR